MASARVVAGSESTRVMIWEGATTPAGEFRKLSRPFTFGSGPPDLGPFCINVPTTLGWLFSADSPAKQTAEPPGVPLGQRSAKTLGTLASVLITGETLVTGGMTRSA